ncbi:MAG: hypothetical protein NTV57_18890 [Cyanobacteria bacterium]|nr:hypothetical protein [Cyanobacteriota bacterium]
MVAEPHPRLGRLLALLLLVASLANGAPFLLARIGLIAPEAYQRDRQAFCPQAGPPAGLVSACSPRRVSPASSGVLERLSLERLHRSPPAWAWLKTARLLILLGLPLAVLPAMLLGRWSWPLWSCLLPALPLLASVGFSIALSLPQAPLTALLPALRSQLWLPLLLLAGPASRPAVLARLAQAMAALLLLQLPLMLVEAVRGLPMSFGPAAAQFAQASLGLPTRLVGSFIQPNSLGVALAALLGFCIAYLPNRRLLPPLALLALPPLLLARSATGLLSWAVVMLFWTCRGRRLPRTARLSLLLLLVPFVAALPLILGRLDLWQSLTGRIRRVSFLLHSSHPGQWLLGHGLLSSSPTDSLPTLLLLQGGLLALLAFYGLLLWVWRRDHRLRPFLLAVLLGGFTLPLTELFPVNALLALSLNSALCRATAKAGEARGA